MGFRFRKTFGTGPLKMTVSKSGIGFSAGVKGARITKPANGKAKATFGIPGTGLSYSKTVGGKKKSTAKKAAAKKTAPKKTDPKKQQAAAPSELTGADIEKSMGCLAAAGRWIFILVMAFLAYLIGFKFRAVFPVAAILVALPVAPWQDLLTNKLHMSIWAKLCTGAAFAIAGMYYTKPPRMALAGMLLVLAIVLAVMNANKDNAEAPAEDQDTEEAPEPADPAPKPEEPETKTRCYIVAGVPYYMDNLMSMAEENYLYAYKKQDLIVIGRTDEKIYKQIFTTSHLDLAHEPDNPHDPNAIKVLLDNKLVGYIPKDDCQHILDIMDNDLFVSANCEVTGGKYKMVNEDYDCIKDKSTYKMETGEDDYAIYIYIRERVM